MKWQLAVALLAFALAPSATAQRPPPPPTSGIYSANLADAGAAAEKRVGSITCKAGLCRSKEAVSFRSGDAMTSCKALFTWRGALTSYGRADRQFTAAELTECNTPPPPRAIPRPPGAPAVTNPKINTLPKTPPG